MLRLKVTGFTINNLGFIILLERCNNSKQNDVLFPLFCGPQELSALSTYFQVSKKHCDKKHFSNQRPSIHVLMYNILQKLKYRVEYIYINSYVRQVLYSQLYLSNKIKNDNIDLQSQNFSIGNDNSVTAIDSRPSDSIILALYCKAPIFICNNIFNRLSMSKSEYKDINSLDLLHEYFSDSTYLIEEEKSSKEGDIEIDEIMKNFVNNFAFGDGFVTSKDTDLSIDDVGALSNETNRIGENTLQEVSLDRKSYKKNNFLSKIEVLQDMLQVAVNKEDYEQATLLRNEINTLKRNCE